MTKLKDLTGKKFGRLTVLSRGENSKAGQVQWFCICDCGNEKLIHSTNLVQGSSKSCGCLSIELTTERLTKHGLYKHALYNTWNDMNDRCNNSNSAGYDSYGGRGVTVCKRWHSSNPNGCKNFIDDMHPSWESGLQIDKDKINPKAKLYSPETCCWLTIKENSNNRRNTVYITANGQKKCLSEWSEILGINPSTLSHRYKSGWSHDKIINEPLDETMSRSK